MTLPSPLLPGSDADFFPAWDGSQVETKGHSVAYVEVMSYGGTPISVTGGVLADNDLAVINLETYEIGTTISAVGYYQIPAAGRLKASGIGSSIVNLLLKAA